jgi:hypothetical protein
MLSVIVAVHNQIGHNQPFREASASTRPVPMKSWSSIIIPRTAPRSFESQGCRVIRNAANLCIRVHESGTRNSTGDYVCHINNDLYVGPN